jgi:hypothetical protein
MNYETVALPLSYIGLKSKTKHFAKSEMNGKLIRAGNFGHLGAVFLATITAAGRSRRSRSL